MMSGSRSTWSRPNVFYAVLLVAVIVAIDLLFFKSRPWARLMVNVGMVLVFAATYFLFLKRR
jgi:NADH:ubiquinone oxidoreductase subunit 3 (subunit A)